MTHYDVFNGDADGICALQQLRLAEPKESTLITGVKRDIQLVQKISADSAKSITVLDISLDKNREALVQLLDKNVKADYFDHHFAGEIPSHKNLNAHIDTAPDTCTSLIVDSYLSGAHRLWAIVGAFGDSFDEKARELASSTLLNETQIEELKKLGIAINYNAYGASEDDLHFQPSQLTHAVRPFQNPLDFIRESEICSTLYAGYNDDFTKADKLLPKFENEKTALYILPNEPWARRVSGVFANSLAKKHTNRAHALLTQQENNSYLVSVRAPTATKTGADDLCRQFETGGGRKAAAGINNLPINDYEPFVAKFNEQFT